MSYCIDHLHGVGAQVVVSRVLIRLSVIKFVVSVNWEPSSNPSVQLFICTSMSRSLVPYITLRWKFHGCLLGLRVPEDVLVVGVWNVAAESSHWHAGQSSGMRAPHEVMQLQCILQCIHFYRFTII